MGFNVFGSIVGELLGGGLAGWIVEFFTSLAGLIVTTFLLKGLFEANEQVSEIVSMPRQAIALGVIVAGVYLLIRTWKEVERIW